MSRQNVNGNSLPFSAIYGNETAKTALLCAAVNPHIKAVLIKGLSGTGKTALARSVCGIDPGKKVVNVPLNVTDEQLFGAIDLELAIATGSVELGESLLMRANRNYLYLDDADLFDANVLTAMLNDVRDGKVYIERENISTSYKCNTTVLASMNSNRKYIDKHVLDCFDMCVTMRKPKESDECEEVIRRNLSFYDGTFSESRDFAADDREQAKAVKAARKLLPQVHISQKQMRNIARICKAIGVKGCRGAISTAQAALALAALAGRKRVTDTDTAQAALLCLEHRRTKRQVRKEKKQYNPLETGYNPLGGIKRFIHDEKGETTESKIVKGMNENDVTVAQVNSGEAFIKSEDMEDVVATIGETFEAIDLLEAEDSNGSFSGDDVAKRRYVESTDRNGKYIKSRVPNGGYPDIAFDATIRAAAPYQQKRQKPGDDGVKLEKQDIREKVRQKQISSTFLFLLDTSGSLIIRNRMSKVKAAMISMLSTHYVKRDRVGLMTFNEERIDLILQPTRAVEQLEPIIDAIVVGQGTPLSAALIKVYEYMMPYTLKHPDEKCHIVLITDGKATQAMDSYKDPIKEALEISKMVNIPNSDWIVIDSGLGYTKNDIPKMLAENLHGKFFLLDDLEVKDDKPNIWKGWSETYTGVVDHLNK